jgi:endonuclease/exonuclease/phosphatase family metal-dependent hydrolase
LVIKVPTLRYPEKNDTHRSYNMRKAGGLDQLRRPGRTLRIMNGLDADVVILKEAEKRLGARHTAIGREMIETETDFQLLEVWGNEICRGWHVNAILVRKGIKAIGVQRLDLTDGLSVVTTHPSLRRRDRIVQLDAIRAATADCPRTVIAGDFNE